MFFWQPDIPLPTGGLKQAYRHVEILDQAGVEARVLHTKRGFVCDWFEHQAPIAYLGEALPRSAMRQVGKVVPRMTPPLDLNLFEGRTIHLPDASGRSRKHTLSADDVLVMPEYPGAELADAKIELPTVILNQNVHGTFRGYGFGERSGSTIYTEPNVLAAIVVSEHNKRYLEYAFEGLVVHRVVNGVNAALFHPNDSPRLRRIAYMPRRMPHHLEQVINILSERGALEGWELAPIAGLSEEGVADVLRHSKIFLSACEEEGFGLPPVEAGMAGCLVVGYTGAAADEYAEHGMYERVDQDDVLGFAQAVERTMKWVDSDADAAIAKARASSEYLSERYSLEREAESVLAAWRALLDDTKQGWPGDRPERPHAAAH